MHPEIQPDPQKRNAEAIGPDLEPEDEPVNRRFFMAMAKQNPHQGCRFRRITDESESLQARIAVLKQENAELRAKDDARAGTKKKRAMPNPNKNFIAIHEILIKGGTVEDLEKGLKPEERGGGYLWSQ